MRALDKAREKRKRLYSKIMQNQDSNVYPMTEVKKKHSYVRRLVERSKLMLQDELLLASLKKKKTLLKKRTHKKTLTVQNPFEFKTEKRIRIDID